MLIWLFLLCLTNLLTTRAQVQGSVSTLAGRCTQAGNDNTGMGKFFLPLGVVASSSNDVFYIADSANNCIRRVTLSSTVSTLICGVNQPTGLTWDPVNGDLVVSDTGSYCLRRIPINNPSLGYIAGRCGYKGALDGPVSSSLFNNPKGIAYDSAGNLIVADELNNCIRKVANGQVTTLAGTCREGNVGFADGTGAGAIFYNPYAVTTDGSGNVYASDTANACIRKITSNGIVTTYSGPCSSGTSKFSYPSFLSYVGAVIYVSDYTANCIKAVYPSGAVGTVAGSCNSRGYLDGAALSSLFYQPYGLALLPSGDVIMSDYMNHCIRRLSRCPASSGFDYLNQACSCGPGYELVSGACQQCKLSYFKSIVGSDLCSQCALGTQSNAAFTACDTCPSGTYRTSSTQTTCQAIPPNSQTTPSGAFVCNLGYAVNNAGTGCDQCQIGTESNSDRSACVSCLTNYYRPALAYSTCISCPSLFTCSSTQSQCKSGYYLDQGASVCVQCALGSSKGVIGNQTCSSCLIGTESNTDRTACQTCPTGKYRPSTSFATCINCPTFATCDSTSFKCLTGYYLDAESNSCIQCAAGYSKNVDGNQLCTRCEIGYESNSLRTACISCVNGSTYRSSFLQSSCQACPLYSQCVTNGFTCIDGYVFNLTGTGCDRCPVGTESGPDEMSCTNCPSGKYRPSLSVTSCLTCPLNAVCNTTSFSCAAGHFLQTSNGSCLKCAFASYKDSVGNQTCILCPSGQEPNQNATSCSNCPMDTYKSFSTQTSCVQCPQNSKCNGSNFTCKLGYIVNSTLDGCEACPVGTESDPTRQTCISCQRGTYRPSLNNVTCVTCPFNATCSTSAFKCNPGFYLDAVSGSCIQCPIGTAKSFLGNDKCTLCDIGYESAPDRNECISCVLGVTFRSNLQESCTPCPKSSTCTETQFACHDGYIMNVSDSRCELCQAGFEPNTNRTLCVQCSVGKFKPVDNQTVCTSCPEHSTCSSTGFICDAGYRFDSVTFNCSKCHSGFFKASPGNVDCIPCGDGYESSGDATFCSLCQPNFYKPSGNDVCISCPEHSFCWGTGFTCDLGYEMNTTNNLSCTQCPSRKYRSSLNQPQCISCPSNAQCDSMSFICDIGFEADGQTCKSCATGTYRASRSWPSCRECPQNSTCSPIQFTCNDAFKINARGDNCTQIIFTTSTTSTLLSRTSGTHTSLFAKITPSSAITSISNPSTFLTELTSYSVASTSSEPLWPSPTGFVCPTNAVCDGDFSQCQAGFYLDSKLSVCTACKAGYVKPGIGNENCETCPAGTEPNSARNLCSLCPPGKFKPTSDILLCIDCPRNALCGSRNFVCVDGFSVTAAGNGCDTMSSLSSDEKLGWSLVEVIIAVIFLVLTVIIIIYQCFYMRKATVSRNFIKAATMDTNASTVTAGSSLNLLGSDTSLFTDALVKKQKNDFKFNASPTLFEDENGLADIPVHVKFEFGQDFELDGFLYNDNAQQQDPHFLGLAKHRELSKYDNHIVVKTVSVIDNTVEVTAFFSEVKIAYRLRENLNIAKFLGYSQVPHWCIITKNYNLGSLDDWIASSASGRSRLILLSFALDVARGVKALHDVTYAHCNLKPSNILVDCDLNDRLFCVVSDFKYARPRMGIPQSRYRPLLISRASCAFAAPEILAIDAARPNSRVINYQKADLYALAMIIYNLTRLKRPWSERIIEI